MDALHCILRVPLDYPNGGKPTLRVTNPDMERGYQINVERGFDRIVADAGTSTLLAYLRSLDRQLESLLSSQKADTIKIVSHSKRAESGEPKAVPQVEAKPRAPALPTQNRSSVTPVYSAEQKSQARQVRESQVRQLEARMGRVPQFSRSTDGLTLMIPIEPRKRSELPVELQAIKMVRLIVPESYNLLPCRIQLIGVEGDSVHYVEDAFGARVSQASDVSLFNHINYLSQNIHIMAKQKPKAEAAPIPEAEESSAPLTLPERIVSDPPGESSSSQPQLLGEVPDRPHIITIPRPPEWQTGSDREAEVSEESSSSDDEDASEEEHTGEEDTTSTSAATTSAERGILVSFPHIELHGIELLEIGMLNITVKCDRCKEIKDVIKLQNNSDGNHSRADSCVKCALPFAIGFRAELIHANSIRAGYLDLDGCTVVDMLPSSFIPTCAECSTAYPQSGVVSVRGETSMAFCRECHRKMTFHLPELKFLRVSASTVRATRAPVRKKKPENLGIVAGHELANRGRCSHYKKSYRWFRFSCCNKVYPCDRCHDQVADHAIEHANRMICGFCSREQNYRPKDCGICHAFLTVRPGKGFWEGGSGTRDRTKMSRKDPRKYKRAKGSKTTS